MKTTPLGVTGLKPPKTTPTLWDQFIVPPQEAATPALPTQEAASKAFYAASTHGDDPVGNYSAAKADLELNGRSSFVDMAEAAWRNEQDAGVKETVQSIIADPTITDNDKKNILSGYALSGYISKDLKDKYIQKTAAKQVDNTVDDVEAQDRVVGVLQQRKNANAFLAQQQHLEDASVDLTAVLEGTGTVGAAIAMSIPAGVAGLYKTIKEKDSAAGAAMINEIMKYSYLPKDEGSKKVVETIGHYAEILGIPAQWIGDYVFEKTDSPGAATTALIVADPLNYVLPAAAVGIKAGVGATAKVLPRVLARSPLAATNVANPAAATKLGASAIVDTTGKVAEAIGADRGAIVHDWVLPKPMLDKDAPMHPDLIQELNRVDKDMRGTFVDTRYDPTVLDATARTEEVDRMMQVVRESNGPTYMQSNSTLIETEDTFAGHAVLGRNAKSGYKNEEAAKAAAVEYQKSVDTLPQENRGVVAVAEKDGEWFVTHDWKHNYDELSTRIFGADSIKSSVLGMDVSGFAATKVGRWFIPTGWLPKWVEAGAMRAPERAMGMEAKLMRLYKDKVVGTKHGKELDMLINDAESKGKDIYSKADLSSMFPHLKDSQINDLFESHTWWRRIQDYNYNWFNRAERTRLTDMKMEGIYDANGNYIGAGTKHFDSGMLKHGDEIWSFKDNAPIKYDAATMENMIVRLDSAVRDTERVNNFALIDGLKAKTEMLPRETLARVPGYSPRRVRENFFVDIAPKKLIVDGKLITDPETLKNYSLTKAAARNEMQANKLMTEMKDIYPDHDVHVRPERQDSYGKLVADYKVADTVFRHSMQRGERLPSVNGDARLEDRLQTAISTVKTMSSMDAFSAWDKAFKNAFIKGFGKFLDRGQFPQYKTDLKYAGNMDRATKTEFDTAQRMFEWYANQKNFETMTDFIWKDMMHGIADKLESIKIPSSLLRDLGKHNPLATVKKLATWAYINLSPGRQLLLQPAQMLEMQAIHPLSFHKNLVLMSRMSFELSKESGLMKPLTPALEYMSKRMGKYADAPFIGEAEYQATFKAIKDSGLFASVDLNTQVAGVFKNITRPLVEDVATRWVRNTIDAVASVPHAFKKYGFDQGEIMNRLGSWLQTKEMWIKQNPTLDWTLKENLEKISFEAQRLSGGMNRAGNLPYQQGAASVVMQFAAIQHKMFMNLMQDNATIMSSADRARLAVTRLGLYGLRYGNPLGAAIYGAVDRYGSEEMKDAAHQELVQRGVADYVMNHLIAAHIEPDTPTDLAVSKMLTPYSDGFLPYYDVAHSMFKWIVQDSKIDKPRYPGLSVLGNMGKAYDDMAGWYITRDVNEESFKQMAYEAAELASGSNNVIQGLLMLGMQDKVTRNGNKYGMEVSKTEAIAKMVGGVTTMKEEDAWNIIHIQTDKKKLMSDMAKHIHTQLMNQRTKIGEQDWEHTGKKINSFLSMLDPKDFNEQDKYDLMDEIYKLDRYSYTTMKESIIGDYVKHHAGSVTMDRQRIKDIFDHSSDEKTRQWSKDFEEGSL